MIEILELVPSPPKWGKKVAIRDYMQLQGRFAHLGEDDIDAIQKNVSREWRHLLQKSKSSEVCQA